MHVMSSYRGNRSTHTQTHTQTSPQTGPITTHCAAASTQCDYRQTIQPGITYFEEPSKKNTALNGIRMRQVQNTLYKYS